MNTKHKKYKEYLSLNREIDDLSQRYYEIAEKEPSRYRNNHYYIGKQGAIDYTEVKETIIYGKPNCPQCTMAKSLLDSRGILFEYIDITTTGKTAAEITGRPDVRSLPQVYLNGKYVGGFNELYKELNTEVVEDNECKACEG